MPTIKDLSGHRYGRLRVVEYAGRANDKQKTTLWKCICSCGNEKILSRPALTGGTTKSCGCLIKEISSKNIKKANEHNTKHGLTNTHFYRIWGNMKHRCEYEKSPYYHDYGGRGIKVCERWKDFMKFKDDMYETYKTHVLQYGEKNTTIERNDVNGDYEPVNCRWATQSEQGRNKRQTAKYEYKGIMYSMYELADLAGIKPATVESRLRRGWNIEKVVETPIDAKMRNSLAKDIMKAVEKQGGE